ncbi:hypothetical protein GYMLUDRAFT_840419 [Collybiopsis luxurians FD-317 M1]|uniref:Uncharacterized protein n=1 Tax=Collybiopsis luxurians FD-317 M1 TaxID=944289 RepID=A0A0D0CK78_9AGAR|nr:hypothetical protein GYMLUDRAFT_840419 [Collybiopsis luxurians FD-317 M1]
MTEYDYSPAAYQRYMETHDRIARWVDNTEAHHSSFRVPFGPRSDIGEDDLDGMSEADEALPSGASAGGWYESRRRAGGRNTSAPLPPPLLYQPQPYAPSPMYPAALASAPVGYGYPSAAPGVYMSPPVSPPVSPQIIIQSVPKNRSHRHRSSKRSSSSSSKTKTYIIPPPGSVGNPMQIPSSYGYSGAPPPPGTYSYPQSALPYTSGSPYSTHPFSPIGSPSAMGPSPPPPYYAPQPQSGTPGTYVIMPKKGRHLRVTVCDHSPLRTCGY